MQGQFTMFVLRSDSFLEEKGVQVVLAESFSVKLHLSGIGFGTTVPPPTTWAKASEVRRLVGISDPTEVVT